MLVVQGSGFPPNRPRAGWRPAPQTQSTPAHLFVADKFQSIDHKERELLLPDLAGMRHLGRAPVDRVPKSEAV